jgi:hypothetical protein
MIKIDKGIPVPDSKAGPFAKYPFASMEIGDSFFSENISSVGVAASFNGKKQGKKFICRRVTEDGISGARVWRVS